jgi:YfdX protein
MLENHFWIPYRSFWASALLSGALAVPAVAQTHADADQPRHDQQPRVEGSRTSPYYTSTSATTSNDRPRITADIETQPQAQLSGEAKQALSQAAARLLLHVDKARQALATNDKNEAEAQINKSLTLARIIDRTAPVSQVSATIRAGDLVYQDQDTVKMTAIPIYAELGEVSVLGPVQAAKAQTRRIPVVQDVELQHTAVTLDASIAKQQLKTAKAALRNEQSEAADQALAAIQTTGVNFSYTEMDLPLIRARENLTLAKQMVKQQRPEAARAALQEAAQSLSAYGKQTEGAHASQVQTLRQQITELSQNLENNTSGAVDKISRLWDQVTQLAG